ncbi:MAG: hypothetical protein DRO95_06030 [Candidatus Altiarchaeales archaeon]|nr:MAG: hypothetical protein DRO95_06030 [Candidatus Altiarchaeales archaeon]
MRKFEMSEYKKFTKDTIIIGLTSLFSKIRGIIFIAVIAKSLGASAYGVYSILMATVQLVVPISSLGMRPTMIRFLAGERDNKKIREGYYSILFLTSVTSLCSSLIMLFSAPVLASTVFGDSQATPVIQVGAFLIFMQTINGISYTFFQTFRKMHIFSFFNLSQNIGDTILAILLVWNNFGLIEIIYSFLIIRLILFVTASLLIYRSIKICPPRISILRQFLSFGTPLASLSISGRIIRLFDRYMIGFFLNSTAVGIYSAAYGIGAILTMFMEVPRAVLVPTVSKLWEERRINELMNHFKFTLKYFLMISIPSIFGLAALSESILTIMTTSEFISQGHLIIPIIAIAVMFYYATYVLFGLIFMLVKKTQINASLLAIGAILNIILNIILIPYFQSNYNYGIMGAAIATFISFFTIGIATVVLSRKYFTFEIEKSFILKSVISASLMAVLVYKIRVNTFPEIFIPISVGAIFYFILLFIFRAFSEKEIKFFKEILISAKSKFLRI